MPPTLYLIPTPLGDSAFDAVFPASNREIINSIDHFIVENARTIRRFFSTCNLDRKISDLHFYELDKHDAKPDFDKFLKPLRDGHHMGLLSEAGVPAVADPGAEIVKRAHEKGFFIAPLVGPSSILLALMGSGLNGQSFAFNGYLPVKGPERFNRIRTLEKRSAQDKQTQIFIETPYRNNQFFADLLKTCAPQTRLCVAVDLTSTSQYIKTHSIQSWQRQHLPDLHKRPAIFLFLKEY